LGGLDVATTFASGWALVNIWSTFSAFSLKWIFKRLQVSLQELLRLACSRIEIGRIEVDINVAIDVANQNVGMSAS
jgi:hypothetical protein